MKVTNVTFRIDHADRTYFVTFTQKPEGWAVSTDVGLHTYSWEASKTLVHKRSPSMTTAVSMLRVALKEHKEKHNAGV